MITLDNELFMIIIVVIGILVLVIGILTFKVLIVYVISLKFRLTRLFKAFIFIAVALILTVRVTSVAEVAVLAHPVLVLVPRSRCKLGTNLNSPPLWLAYR